MNWLLPHTLPLPSARCLYFLVFLLKLTDGRWGREESNHAMARKPGPLKIIKYSLLYTVENLEKNQCSCFSYFCVANIRLSVLAMTETPRRRRTVMSSFNEPRISWEKGWCWGLGDVFRPPTRPLKTFRIDIKTT